MFYGHNRACELSEAKHLSNIIFNMRATSYN